MIALALVALVAVAAAVWVAAPLRRPRAAATPIDDRAQLELARDAKLREIRDAELDYRTGKLSDSDYARVDAALRAEASAILRQLDDVEGEPAATPAPTPG